MDEVIFKENDKIIKIIMKNNDKDYVFTKGMWFTEMETYGIQYKALVQEKE